MCLLTDPFVDAHAYAYASAQRWWLGWCLAASN